MGRLELSKHRRTKMLTKTINVATSYASQKNARFNNGASLILKIKDRWNDTYNDLPSITQRTVDRSLSAAIAEWRRRNPDIKNWDDLLDKLPESKNIQMKFSKIDATMQRLLKHFWCCEILNNFNPVKVMPIQVYKPNKKKEEYVAWDGQHTLVVLWIIATQIFELDPEKDEIMVPVNVYKTDQKPEMRDSFVGHNGGEYKELLDTFDQIEQMIYGVRIDGSKKPEWILVEAKQQILEKYDLFLTKTDFGDSKQAGAISRTQEFMKLNPETLDWVCDYLVAAGCHNRPVVEKEIVMMSYFFDRCRAAKIKVDSSYIYEIASITKKYWNCDFEPNSTFWVRAQIAYQVWHDAHVYGVSSRFNKEPLHGYPFLVKQLSKNLPHLEFPEPRTNSEFVPADEDLFI
jgi:hypothetical protein